MKIGMLIALVAAAGGTYYVSTLVPEAPSEPTAPRFIQAAQGAGTIPPPGFKALQVRRADEIHQDIVVTLNDIGATKGVPEIKDTNGNVLIMPVEPKFGFSRMSRVVRHGDQLLWTQGVRREGDPWLLLYGAKGKRLSASNIVEGSRYEGSLAKSVAEVTKSLRKRVAEVNLGRSAGFETDSFYVYAKPLKLTKKECLPCHSGMKVGDVVGISVFAHAKPSANKG